MSAERGEASLSGAGAPVLAARFCTLPLAALSLWVLLTFVGVQLTLAAWCATFVWICAGLFGPLVFAALRVIGNSTAEPVAMLSIRFMQAAAVAGLASAGGGRHPDGLEPSRCSKSSASCGVYGFVGAVRDMRHGFARGCVHCRCGGVRCSPGSTSSVSSTCVPIFSS